MRDQLRIFIMILIDIFDCNLSDHVSYSLELANPGNSRKNDIKSATIVEVDGTGQCVIVYEHAWVS